MVFLIVAGAAGRAESGVRVEASNQRLQLLTQELLGRPAKMLIWELRHQVLLGNVLLQLLLRLPCARPRLHRRRPSLRTRLPCQPAVHVLTLFCGCWKTRPYMEVSLPKVKQNLHVDALLDEMK